MGCTSAHVLVFMVDHVDLGNGALIGAFNVLKDLKVLTLGEHAIIGHWNWISCSRVLGEAGASCVLHVGAHSAITSRHYIDCSGGIRVGTHTTIAGVRSTFFTHGISWQSSAQVFSPIEIGDYCLISSNVQVSPGTVVGNRIVVGMGATIAGRLLDPGLYIQSRATLVKSDLDGEYFRREEGHIATAEAHVRNAIAPTVPRIKTQLAGLTPIRDELGQRGILRFMSRVTWSPAKTIHRQRSFVKFVPTQQICLRIGCGGLAHD